MQRPSGKYLALILAIACVGLVALGFHISQWLDYLGTGCFSYRGSKGGTFTYCGSPAVRKLLLQAVVILGALISMSALAILKIRKRN